MRRADLLPLLDQLLPVRLSRRLPNAGVIKRVAATCRCQLTRIGRGVTAALCRLTHFALIPEPV